jgi:hypothetical protein
LQRGEGYLFAYCGGKELRVGVLKNATHTPPKAVGVLWGLEVFFCNRLTKSAKNAFLGEKECVQYPKEGTFTTPVRAKYGDSFALFYHQRDIAESGQPWAISKRDVFKGECRL